MTSEITYAGTLEYPDIERTLKAIADENPEYVYQSPYGDEGSCVYSSIESESGNVADMGSFAQNKITPSCIVGHLVYRLFGEFALRQLNWHCNMGGWQNAFGALQIHIASNKSSHLLNTAQSLQDRRIPWGRAVSEAIRIANEYAELASDDSQVMRAIDEAGVAWAAEEAGKEKTDATVGENPAGNSGAVSDL